MSSIVPLRRVTIKSEACAQAHLALAQKLSDTADWIEGRPAGSDGFFEEDAVAALRWAVAFLRRPTMRDEDLGGALLVVRRVVPEFEALVSGWNGPDQGGTPAVFGRPRVQARLVKA